VWLGPAASGPTKVGAGKGGIVIESRIISFGDAAMEMKNRVEITWSEFVA
jgi:hypothetical protein